VVQGGDLGGLLIEEELGVQQLLVCVGLGGMCLVSGGGARRGVVTVVGIRRGGGGLAEAGVVKISE